MRLKLKRDEVVQEMRTAFQDSLNTKDEQIREECDLRHNHCADWLEMHNRLTTIANALKNLEKEKP